MEAGEADGSREKRREARPSDESLAPGVFCS